MGKLLLKLLLGYVEKHPDQVVDLLNAAVGAGIKALRAHNAKDSTPTPPSA